MLQEQRKQEMETLLRQMEAKALVLMTQKEKEISRTLRRAVATAAEDEGLCCRGDSFLGKKMNSSC